MHYKNGREARNGDTILVTPDFGNPYVGILYQAASGNDYCNGKVAITKLDDPMPNLKDCLRIDDVGDISDS